MKFIEFNYALAPSAQLHKRAVVGSFVAPPYIDFVGTTSQTLVKVWADDGTSTHMEGQPECVWQLFGVWQYSTVLFNTVDVVQLGMGCS